VRTPPIVVIRESGLTIIELELELGPVPNLSTHGHHRHSGSSF